MEKKVEFKNLVTQTLLQAAKSVSRRPSLQRMAPVLVPARTVFTTERNLPGHLLHDLGSLVGGVFCLHLVRLLPQKGEKRIKAATWLQLIPGPFPHLVFVRVTLHWHQ